VPAQICDYAYLIWGLVELYEATFKPRYLEAALEFNEQLIKYFRDEKAGGFYNTASDSEKALVRQKEIYDGALPSGNSVAILNLLRLSRLLAKPELEAEAIRTGRAFYNLVQNMPSAFAMFMTAADFAASASHEIVIVGGPEAVRGAEMLDALRKRFMPGAAIIFIRGETEKAAIGRLAPYTGQMSNINGKTTAYVCRNNACSLPTTDIQTMLRLLENP
jgi:uncharacterized protein